MNSELFKAILALDSYNRGYNAGIEFGVNSENIGVKIGNAVITKNSSSLGMIAGTGIRQDANENFYAIAYSYAGGTVISYRGTDNPGPDLINGWVTGAGIIGKQAIYAARFYNAVVGIDNPLARNDVSFTGHSLGGGLAGLMSTLYGKKATLFDNMPFELAASRAPSVAPTDYYFNGANTLYTLPNLGLLTSYATTGEALTGFRAGQATPVTYFDSNGGPRNPVNLHSQALLINLMYAEQAGFTDWNKIGTEFINALFDPTIASAAGFGSVVGAYPIAQKMLSAIAYSAIDEGVRIFGDTAIRAMFNDANELGKATGIPYYIPGDEYQTNPFYYAPSILNNNVKNITNILTQFAAKLAFDKVLQSNSPTAVNGVLELSGDGEQLDINFGSSLWGTTSDIIGRSSLISDLLFRTSLSSGTIRSSMQTLWGSSADNVFDHVVLATKDSDITANIITTPSSTGKANLFVGGKGNDIITGSNGNDLLIGGKGINTISGGSGNDIIVGGEGKDTLSGGIGNDIFMFGEEDGIDIITDAEDGDRVSAKSAIIAGAAAIAQKDLYKLNNYYILKQGSDLAVDLGEGSIVRIKNFFKSTYDLNTDYSFMGITIPKIVDEDKDGVDDNIKGAKTISDPDSAAYQQFLAAVRHSLYIDPLVIDMSGNGIALNSWQTSGVLFDLNGDGVKEKSGWTKANGDDAFLVIDKNANGTVDAGELTTLAANDNYDILQFMISRA